MAEMVSVRFKATEKCHDIGDYAAGEERAIPADIARRLEGRGLLEILGPTQAAQSPETDLHGNSMEDSAARKSRAATKKEA